MDLRPTRKLTSGDLIGHSAEGQPVTWGEIENAVRELREWAALKSTTGQFSTYLLYQLAGHWCRMPQPFGAHHLLVDVHEVLNQIGLMERAPLSQAAPTKKAEQFTNGPLVGLWHKHWFQASFIPRNLLEENEKYGVQLLYRALNARFGKDGWEGKTVDKEVIWLLTSATVDGALENRAGRLCPGKRSRLTGEWIVFAQCKARRIYLTLAGHDDDQSEVLKRCMIAVREFPELAHQLPFSHRGYEMPPLPTD